MDIGFDPTKDAINHDKHGVSLAFGTELFRDPNHIVISSLRLIDGEERLKAIGVVEGRVWVAIHVLRGGRLRFISVRRANDGEERLYSRP